MTDNDEPRVVHLSEEAPRILGRAPRAWAMLAAPVPSYRIEAIHRELLAMGRGVSVNVNEVPVRATSTSVEGDQ